MEIKHATTKEDFLGCWELMQLLYPHLDQEQYLSLILYMMDENYNLYFIEIAGKIVSLCGYRYQTTLDNLRSIYIDHLCTLPEVRKRGYATALLNKIIAIALEAECKTITFNHPYQHAEGLPFFLNVGFKITAYHLVCDLNPPE